MNIIFLTSSMAKLDFSEYLKYAKITPNPSNQVFYHRLIKCLSYKNTVNVISLRPIAKDMFTTSFLEEKFSIEDSIQYSYCKVSCKKSYKKLHERDDIVNLTNKIIRERELKDLIIFVDTLRVNLVLAAIKLSRIHNAKVIGVVTDNPTNFSLKNKNYSRKILKEGNRLSGYICLTEKLNKIFNTNNKKYYILHGLVDEFKSNIKQPVGNYFFFGGSLYTRYGVKSLVSAICNNDELDKLLIAGDGELAKYINGMSHYQNKLLYLSTLSNLELQNLMSNSIGNINPRPLDYKMDSESVPSKMFEYLSSGSLTISTKHPVFYEEFKDNVIWIENSNSDGIATALKSVYNMSINERQKMASSAKIKVFEKYGISIQSELIYHFIESVKTS